MARKIQEGTLPKSLPDLPGWQIEARWRPARQVSGDFYDFFLLEDGRLGIVVGDVTDKGVPAALVLATTRSVIRATARQFNSPERVMTHANIILCEEMPPKMFVTCLYMVLDPESGSIQIANAGHNYPILCSKNQVDELRARGMPLGLLPSSTYEEVNCTIDTGEGLLLYSDGLVEAHSPEGEMYGFPRLRELLAEFPRRDQQVSAGELIEYLDQDLNLYTGSEWEQEDDVTFLALGRELAVENNNNLREQGRSSDE